MTGPRTGREGEEKSDQTEGRERAEHRKGEHKDGVDKSNTRERMESSQKPRRNQPDSEMKEKPREDDKSREKEKERKPEKPAQPKGKAYDDSNRVEREGKSPYELPKSVRPEQGPGTSYQPAGTRPVDFPQGKDPKTQIEEARKKAAEDAERTKQEQRRLMSRLRQG